MAIGTVVGGMKVTNLGGRGVIFAPIAGEIKVGIPEMVRVSGGTFSMGSTRWADTQPIRQVTLNDFAIGKYPVTNGEWLGFLQVMGRTIPDLVDNTELAFHPVVNVSWNAATEYCEFLNSLKIPREAGSGFRKFGLPTEAQWEFAARGTEGREYPWGNEWDASKVVFNTSGTSSVDTHSEGASWCGAMHMSGNVWEWVQDWYAHGYNAEDLKNPKGPDNGTYRVLRGGSWCHYDSDTLSAAYRAYNFPGGQNNRIGIRLAEDLG